MLWWRILEITNSGNHSGAAGRTDGRQSADAGIILLGFSVSIGRRSCMGLSLVLRVYILMREGASRPVVNTNNVDGVFLLIYPEDDAVRVMRGAAVR